MLLTLPVQIQAAESKATVTCIQDDISQGASVWSLTDQSCLRMSLGLLSPGTLLNSTYPQTPQWTYCCSPQRSRVYQQEQNYRRADVWESSSVFEDFTGRNLRWSSPTDRGATRWYLVVDNLDHPQDQDQGALRGSSVGVPWRQA